MLQVGQAMTPDPIFVPPSMTMATAAQLMLSRKVRLNNKHAVHKQVFVKALHDNKKTMAI
jgi:CBS domain-containing protein